MLEGFCNLGNSLDIYFYKHGQFMYIQYVAVILLISVSILTLNYQLQPVKLSLL